jgi:hypothetical protein
MKTQVVHSSTADRLAEAAQGELVEASPDVWADRVRGIGMGAGACIASIEPQQAQLVLALELAKGHGIGRDQRNAARRSMGR